MRKLGQTQELIFSFSNADGFVLGVSSYALWLVHKTRSSFSTNVIQTLNQSWHDCSRFPLPREFAFIYLRNSIGFLLVSFSYVSIDIWCFVQNNFSRVRRHLFFYLCTAAFPFSFDIISHPWSINLFCLPTIFWKRNSTRTVLNRKFLSSLLLEISFSN